MLTRTCAVAWLAAAVLLSGLLYFTTERAAARGDDKTPTALDPNQPYQARKVNPVTYDIDYSVVVTAPHQTKVLKVWLPLPQTDAGQEVEPGRLTTFPMKVAPRVGTEKVYGNKFAFFAFDHPEGAQIIRHQFRAKVWELRWDVDPAKIVKVPRWPASFAPYLKGDAAVALDDTFAATLRGMVKERKGPAHDLDQAMVWLQENMKYDHSKASLSADARRAFETRTGHCSDYHGLCASFGRALGLPTRVVYGIFTIPKNSPSHCKLEAYLPSYDWVAFDISETQNMVKAIRANKALGEAERSRLVKAAQARLKRGFRDNTWLLQTRGTDYELVPAGRQKVRVVRTIYAEADGQPLPDPDPADATRKEFAWMTVHQFTPDRPVAYPFKDLKSLQGPGE
jgi:transglutaminase-like putative cysteine protease